LDKFAGFNLLTVDLLGFLHNFKKIFIKQKQDFKRCVFVDQIECDDVLTKYKNPKLIHQGGQRDVYIATNANDEEIILKIGKYKTSGNPNVWDIERIENEILLQQRIDSDYYPKNISFEKISGSRFVITEEYIESKSLAECMCRFQDPYEILTLIKHLVKGLNVIWKMKYAHLDVKPDNILITHKDIPVIIDLGIAKQIGCESNGGSEDYISPEQLNHGRVDIRMDQFNLGIILLQLLSNGKHPFDPNSRGSKDIAVNIYFDRRNKKVFENDYLEPISRLASMLLAPKPDDRFESPEKLLENIDELRDKYE
jgi:serine/threonine protein kinase